MLKIALLFLLSQALLGVTAEDDSISLGFVIDDTGSMTEDIHQVKEQVDSIFNAALQSNGSRIKDFILYTFNDPTTKLRTKTLDRDLFKKELAAIQVDGGDDCPEMALTGLEEALKLSRKGSIMYLFTDASAKDYKKYEEVKKLAKEKDAKLNFILTGTCYFGEDNQQEDHRVYFKLADDTQGQVFSLFKKEVGQILNYAKESVAAFSRGGAAAPAVLYADALDVSTNSLDFKVTEAMKEVLISVSGPSPVVTVTGPDGKVPKIEDVAKTSGATVIKILEATPGNYTLKVDGVSSKVVVTGINTSGTSSKIIEE